MKHKFLISTLFFSGTAILLASSVFVEKNYKIETISTNQKNKIIDFNNINNLNFNKNRVFDDENSFSGNEKDLGIDFVEHQTGGFLSEKSSKKNNLDFTISTKTNPIIVDKIDEQNLKKEILNNVIFNMNFNNWDLDNIKTQNLNDSSVKQYFDLTNIKKVKTINTGLYSISDYSWDFITKENKESNDKKFILDSKRNDENNRFDVFDFDLPLTEISTNNLHYPLAPNLTIITREASGYINYDFSKYLNKGYAKVKTLIINDKSIPIRKSLDIKVSYLEGATSYRNPSNQFYPTYLWQKWKKCEVYYKNDNNQWIVATQIEPTETTKKIVVKIFYDNSYSSEELLLNPNTIIKNDEIEKINTIKVITDFQYNNLIKINLNDSNKLNDNGNVWTKAPNLNFDFNDEYFLPAKELFNLKNLVININNFLINENLTENQKKNLNNLKFNILQLNDSYQNFYNEYLEILNNKKDINLSLSPTLDIYIKYFKYQPNAKNFDLWDQDYLILSTILNNSIIKVHYLTPESKKVKEQIIWNKSNFIPIVATNSLDRNSNFINLLNLTFDSNNETKIINFSDGTIKYDKKFDNVYLKNKTLFYKFYYRNNAKNYSDLNINTRNKDYRSIELPLNLYLDEFIDDNYNFIESYKNSILNALNQTINTTNKVKIFDNIFSINDKKIIQNFEDWNDALNYFGIAENNLNSLKNNSTGIFYLIASVKNWKFCNDISENTFGDYGSSFIENLNKNKDIYPLKTNIKNNNGYFLIKAKSNKRTTLINLFGDKEKWKCNFKEADTIWDDIRNPLTIFNTLENQENIKNFFQDKNNLKEQTIVNKELLEKEKRIKITTTKTYSIDNNKVISLNLNDGLTGTFLSNKIKNKIENYDLNQDFLEKIYNSIYNFTNPKTQKGEIVNFINDLEPKYELNPRYQLTISSNYLYINNKILYSAKITNNNSDNFNYQITVENLKKIFDIQYKNNSSTLSDEYLKLLNELDNNIKSLSKKEIQYQNIELPITSNNIPNKNNLSVNVIIAVSICSIFLTFLSFIVVWQIIYKKQKNKKIIYKK